MKTQARIVSAAGLAAGLMLASSAFAVALPSTLDFGRAGEDGVADRVVTITPDVTSIGVYRNQTVKFIDAATGRSFTWKFDTLNTGFTLDQVAPDAAGLRQIRAYVWDTGRQSG